jgi:alkylhydroperoxidase/carboxymuconolactone decarboxylase family protein YurZ
VLVTAAIVLAHPAMLPAAVMLIWLAAIARPPRIRRVTRALAALALAAALDGVLGLAAALCGSKTRAPSPGASLPA